MLQWLGTDQAQIISLLYFYFYATLQIGVFLLWYFKKRQYNLILKGVSGVLYLSFSISQLVILFFAGFTAMIYYTDGGDLKPVSAYITFIGISAYLIFAAGTMIICMRKHIRGDHDF